MVFTLLYFVCQLREFRSISYDTAGHRSLPQVQPATSDKVMGAWARSTGAGGEGRNVLRVFQLLQIGGCVENCCVRASQRI